MANVTAKIQVESVLDTLIESGWDVSLHAETSRTVLRLRRGRQPIQSEGRSLVEAYMRIVNAENQQDLGVSTEGAAWAAEGGR